VTVVALHVVRDVPRAEESELEQLVEDIRQVAVGMQIANAQKVAEEFLDMFEKAREYMECGGVWYPLTREQRVGPIHTVLDALMPDPQPGEEPKDPQPGSIWDRISRLFLPPDTLFVHTKSGRRKKGRCIVSIRRRARLVAG
jgi:hypothetical protein